MMISARLGALCLAAGAASAASGAFVDPFAAAALSEPEDLTHDGIVDSRDLALVLGEYGRRITGGPDINADGIVDTLDMSLVLGAWSHVRTIRARHVGGDASGWRVYVDSVIDIERSPLRADWTRIWALDLETGQVLGFDVDVYLEAADAVLRSRNWAGPRDWH
ncbi:MAG: hypothetical protein ACF8QF_01295 [Phycisphaerales bacterium]